VWLAILDTLVKRFPILRNVLKRGDAFEEEFYTERYQDKGHILIILKELGIIPL